MQGNLDLETGRGAKLPPRHKQDRIESILLFGGGRGLGAEVLVVDSGVGGGAEEPQRSMVVDIIAVVAAGQICCLSGIQRRSEWRERECE